MIQHTKGPWHSGHECISGTISVWSGDAMVAQVGGRRLTAEQSRIDAFLIAAAPELMALVLQYRSDLFHPPSADSKQRRIEAIDDVIAKVMHDPR